MSTRATIKKMEEMIAEMRAGVPSLGDDRFNKKSKYIFKPKNTDDSCIFRGFLSKSDLICLKSLEKKVPNDTLLWFAKYLIYKAQQPRWIHIGCLVSESEANLNEDITQYKDISSSSDEEKCTYRILVLDKM